MGDRTYCYDNECSSQYLRDTGHMVRAQMTWQYWDPATDTVHQWNGAGGQQGFKIFRESLPDDALGKWRNYKQSCANMVAYNWGNWGPLYTNLDVRGHTITWPGGFGQTWHPTKEGRTVSAYEVDRWPGMPILPDDHIQFGGWYYQE